jgi:hypothetical protein
MTLSAGDRLAILDVITRADEAASRRDADAYVALFTEDVVLDGTQGRYAGPEALVNEPILTGPHPRGAASPRSGPRRRRRR